MKWEKHKNSPLYEWCTDYDFPVLVRIIPLDKGHLWQVDKLYGYEPTIDMAKLVAEETVLMKLMENQS